MNRKAESLGTHAARAPRPRTLRLRERADQRYAPQGGEFRAPILERHSGQNDLSAGLARRVLALILLGYFCLADVTAQSQPAAAEVEYQIKAVFLFNFTKFVEWPEKAFADALTPITIGIIGENPFGSLLDQTVNGELVKGRKLEVKLLGEKDSPNCCHVLFVSHSLKGRVGEILERVGSAPILTVSEIDGFAQQGGMINFVVLNKNVRFEVNPSRAQRVGLAISSKLLRLPKAIKVEDAKKEN